MNRLVKSLNLKALAIFGSVLFLFLSSAQALIICRLGKEVRTLRIEPGPTSCKAIYTKAGIDSNIGTSVMNSNGCNGIVDGVRKNIESAGWKCKEAKEAKISELINEKGVE